MKTNELKAFLLQKVEEIKEVSAQIIAETATTYYKERFKSKAFDGQMWLPSSINKTRGSLLIDTGKLVNSIRPSYVSSSRVIISAGNNKVNYAQTHNEGSRAVVQIKAHTRKSQSGKVSQVKAHNKSMNIPQRQFMGEAKELNRKIKERIKGYIRHINEQ